MSKVVMPAVRQVLKEAGNMPQFFDLSDAERLNWMIARGFEIGKRRRSRRRRGHERAARRGTRQTNHEGA